MSYCPRAGCGQIGTEMVSVYGQEIAFCAHDAAEERRMLAQAPKQPDPLGLSKSRQIFTKVLHAPQRLEEQPARLVFNDLGEPTELVIGTRRYRVFPR